MSASSKPPEIPAEPAAGRPFPPHVATVQRMITTVHTGLYRLSGGNVGGQMMNAPVLLLLSWGRRSGALRTTPLLYLQDGANQVIVASNGGSDKPPAWWLNLQANPNALVQIGSERHEVRATTATPLEKAVLWPRLVALYPGYAEYQERTTRPIPVVVLRSLEEGASYATHHG